MVALVRPSTEQIWRWLDQIPDPEIPVITLVDLGVIRGVSWAEDMLVITVTPTYSGCPATRVIQMDIEAALSEKGVMNLKVVQQLSPSWTTDFLSKKGRDALENFGISPPHTAAGPQHCPLCKSRNVEKISQFGSTPCKALWRCCDCCEPFDYFKCI
ncbi:MAG: phenylacetate-CoA oxygenase subunit PaaJ [Alphaproteobacteria bacterium]|nr:phenylacetate-CoA oxygenase subunit PaaJ [Alphaproteobacteria bacterium]